METLLADADRLVKTAWGARAEAGAIRPLAGDASSRRYFRVDLRGGPAPTSVLMVQSGSGLSISSDELSAVTEAPKEMPFLNVQRYLRSHGIAVPEVYAAESSNGLALLEDVGDTTLWDAARAAADPAALYHAAIDELIAIQRAGELAPDPQCLAFQGRFDARLFSWEFDHFLEYGFTGRSLAPGDRARLEQRFVEIADELVEGRSALTHRDYHSWNLFVHQGTVRVIDFQDALIAPVAYDLATLLNDRATPTLVEPRLERALVERFCAKRSTEFGDPPSVDEFQRRYYLFVLQKSLKIVGRFHYLEAVKGKEGYVAMLPHTFATLRRCFTNLPALEDVRDVLLQSFPELA